MDYIKRSFNLPKEIDELLLRQAENFEGIGPEMSSIVAAAMMKLGLQCSELQRQQAIELMIEDMAAQADMMDAQSILKQTEAKFVGSQEEDDDPDDEDYFGQFK